MSSGKLSDHGGKVLQNVKVVPIFWSSATLYQAEIVAFYTALVAPNPYFALMFQYRTTSPAQSIGYGSVAPAFVASGVQSTGPVGVYTISEALNHLITAGSVPAPDANTYYAFHFPPGLVVGDSYGTVCINYCAYHTSDFFGNQQVYFGVMPDLTQPSCPCHQTGFSYLEDLQAVSGHEVFEAVTDAGGDAWYAPNGDEIADLCAWQISRVQLGDGKSYAVQKQWSNRATSCSFA